MGVLSKKEGRDKEPFELNTICAIASCTKPMTSVCVMQCVERGLLDLDADARDIIPEYGQYGVITGWGEEKDEAIIEPMKGSATIR
jgi:CubicO group peptidase (beta-lactamase class C family)